MTRIQDIAAFNEVREAGLAKLVPQKPRIGVGMGTCGSGNGAEAVFQAFASAIDARGLAVELAPVGCFGFCAEEPLVNVSVPGRPLLMLHRVQPEHVDPILGGLGQGKLPPPELVLCKIEEWDHITGHVKYGQGYPRAAPLERAALLQGPAEAGAAQLRPDQPRRHRGVHRDRRLPGALQGPDRRQPRGCDRAGEGGQAARPRRGRLPDRQQVGVPARGARAREVPRLQRGRRRPRRLHEPQRDRERPPLARRGHGDRRLRDRRPEGHSVRARRVPARRAPPRARDRAGPRLRHARREHPRPRLQVRPGAGRGRGRLRLRRGDGAHRVARGPGGAAAPAPALPRPEGPLGQAHQHQQRRDLVQRRPDRLQGPRLVRGDGQPQERGHQGVLAGGQGAQHRARGDAARDADREVRLRHRRRRRATAATSRRSRPAAPPAAASRPTCSTPPSTTRASPRSARSWARAAWS